jgi:general secretion pathway protein A
VYTSFFGFKENPFNLTPDPRYLFLSPYHKEALDHLLYGINERKGFIAITGGIGTGKTTLCRSLLSHLDESTKTALVFNAFISDMELLETINQEFGIDMEPKAASKKGYIDVLNDFLLKTFSSGGNAVLLIDEAQNLSHPVLEQIRMISNLETEKDKLIQIVLVGQSELKEHLAAYSLKQLDDRIMVRYDLKSLDFKDVRGYVDHRLVVAGGRGDLKFTRGALKEIHAHSRGNPRRINAVCDRVLLIAYAREKHIISKEMVGKAIDEIRGDRRTEHGMGDWSWRRMTMSTLLLLILILVAGIGGWSFKGHILDIFLDKPKKVPIKTREAPPRVIKPKKKEAEASLFLDEKTSLAGLFDLFKGKTNERNYDVNAGHLGLVSIDIGAEYYVMLKRPFRIHLSDTTPITPKDHRYLLIREVTQVGAIAIDAAGKTRPITRDFVLNHWGQKVSWAYPYKNKIEYLRKGMNVPDVLKVQRTLNEIGYLLTPSGVYDEFTFREVMRFQTDFGLTADGIVGPRTRALLFQMSD